MKILMDWLCLLCVTFLIFDIMVYFCKDASEVMKASNKAKHRPIKRRTTYVYEEKIAK